MPRRKVNRQRVWDLLDKGLSGNEVSEMMNISVMTVSKIRNERRDLTTKVENFDIEEYDKTIVTRIASVANRILEELNERPLTQTPIGQLVQAFNILNQNKLLAEGKATQHVAVAAYHKLSDEDKEWLAGMIAGYKTKRLQQVRGTEGRFVESQIEDD